MLKTATSGLRKHSSQRTVDFWCQGEELRVGFMVAGVSRLLDRGIESLMQVGKQSLRRADGAVVAPTRRGGLCVLQCQVVFCPMLLALVDEEPAGEALGLPLVDREMERESMGREDVTAPVALELPALREPSSDERRYHGHTTIPYQAWCHVCV